MKKNILVLTAACVTLTLSSTAQTKFGIRAGVQMQNVNAKDHSGTKADNKLMTGYHAGLTADIPVAPDYFIQPGLLYSLKGTNQDYANAKARISYIEVPVNFIYKPTLGSGKLLLGFGPYVAVAIDGKVKWDNGSEADVDIANTIPVTATDNYYVERMDAGANFLAGYEFTNKLSFQLNAQLGLSNISPEDQRVSNSKAVSKNTGFGLSLGYKF